MLVPLLCARMDMRLQNNSNHNEFKNYRKHYLPLIEKRWANVLLVKSSSNHPPCTSFSIGTIDLFQRVRNRHHPHKWRVSDATNCGFSLPLHHHSWVYDLRLDPDHVLDSQKATFCEALTNPPCPSHPNVGCLPLRWLQCLAASLCVLGLRDIRCDVWL